MNNQIKFDHAGESQSFTIGEDEIFFRNNTGENQDKISVMNMEDGSPYSHTNRYIDFKNIEDAERFLKSAQSNRECPYGWE